MRAIQLKPGASLDEKISANLIETCRASPGWPAFAGHDRTTDAATSQLMRRSVEDFVGQAGVVARPSSVRVMRWGQSARARPLRCKRVPYRLVVEAGRVLGGDDGIAQMEVIAMRLREAGDRDFAVGLAHGGIGKARQPCSKVRVRSCSGLSLSGLDFGGIGILVRGRPAWRVRHGPAAQPQKAASSTSGRPARAIRAGRPSFRTIGDTGRVRRAAPSARARRPRRSVPSDCSHIGGGRKRDLDQPAAAFADAPQTAPPARPPPPDSPSRNRRRRRERVRAALRGGLRRARHEGALLHRQPGGGLRHFLPAAPPGPRPFVAVGRDRDIDHARRDMGQRSRRKAEPAPARRAGRNRRRCRRRAPDGAASSASAGLARSRNVWRLPAPMSRSKPHRPACVRRGSTSTSAPCEASRRAQAGPASSRVRSSTRKAPSGDGAVLQAQRRRLADFLEHDGRAA